MIAPTQTLQLVLALSLALWPLAPALAQEGAPKPAVVVAPAEMVDLQATASFSGRLVAVQKVDLRARVSGFLDEVAFTEGRPVAEGALLFAIEDDAYLAAVAEIEGQVVAAEARRQLAEVDQERVASLAARGTLSQADLDRADAELAQAEGVKAQLEAQRKRAELDLSYTRITAPFAGIAGLAQYDVGALVSPESGPLVTLTAPDPMSVEFPVSTALLLDYTAAVEAGEVSAEGTVSIRLPNGDEYPQNGTLNFIDAQVGRGTDTVLLRAEFPNPDGRLLDGALVQVVLEQEEGQSELAVPAQAVQRDMAGPFVMVVSGDGTVEQRRIDAGRSSQGMTVVASGLDAGETVITEGINKVRPGIQVDAAPASGG